MVLRMAGRQLAIKSIQLSGHPAGRSEQTKSLYESCGQVGQLEKLRKEIKRLEVVVA